jgi:formate hydrogenlyase transcriptional activator
MTVPYLIGESPSFQATLEEINMVAPVDCGVLLRGETGTGKVVVARAIHDGSRRRHNQFVAVNCAAIPSGLIESELFGHDRGAFTGAVTQTMGRFQIAHRGTLFLDEIGDLPLELQPKLLRVLQERQLERLGSHQTVQVDVRIIAATNQDLWGMVQQGTFRADLYYRLNVFPITLAPLRERLADVPLFVEHFVKQFAARNGKFIKYVPDEVMEALKCYDWPGNVRELQNCIERAVVMTTGPALHLPASSLQRVSRRDTAPATQTLAETERNYIVRVLDEVGWKVGGPQGAAVRLGLPRTTLMCRMHKLGIARPTARHSMMGIRNAAVDRDTGPYTTPDIDVGERARGGLAAVLARAVTV